MDHRPKEVGPRDSQREELSPPPNSIESAIRVSHLLGPIRFRERSDQGEEHLAAGEEIREEGARPCRAIFPADERGDRQSIQVIES